LAIDLITLTSLIIFALTVARKKCTMKRIKCTTAKRVN